MKQPPKPPQQAQTNHLDPRLKVPENLANSEEFLLSAILLGKHWMTLFDFLLEITEITINNRVLAEFWL